MKLLTRLILLFAMLYSANTFAKSTDEDAPVHIEADQLEMRERDSVSIYNGNVIITKGSMKITGDKIIIKNRDGSLYRIKVNGRPATFYQLNDLGEAISAESYFMNYQATSGLLELKEKALLLKNNNRFSSEHIIYDTLKDIIKAGNHNSPNPAQAPRVKITIHPENNNKKQ